MHAYSPRIPPPSSSFSSTFVTLRSYPFIALRGCGTRISWRDNIFCPAKTSANWIWAADKRPIPWPSWPLRDPLTGGPRYPFNRRLKLAMREIRTFFFPGGIYTTLCIYHGARERVVYGRYRWLVIVEW